MRFVAVIISALLVTGCASNSYQIPRSELARIAATPPEQRANRVLVSQELSATDVESAQPVYTETQIVWVPDLGFSFGDSRAHGHGGHWSSTGGGHHGGGGGGGGKGGSGGAKLGSGGSDAKGAAVALVVLAAVGLIIVAGVEGSRYDGWVRMHPMHPVHLIGKDGSQTTIPLAWVDQNALAYADKAIVRPNEGPWQELQRKPLSRQGGTYSLYGGYGTSRSVLGDVDFGPSFLIQGGYFPTQEVGILADVAFDWRTNQFGGTLFDSRYLLELQLMPLSVGKLHLGGYVGGGLGYRWEDVPGATISNGNNGTTVLIGGAQLQLELHTRLALTARVGAVKAHGDRETDLLFGLAVY